MEGVGDDMDIVDLFIAVLVLIVMLVALVIRRAKRVQRRKALEQRRERDSAGLALVRYIQLNRQCSEKAAYERLAAFVKKQVLFDDPIAVAGKIEPVVPGFRPWKSRSIFSAKCFQRTVAGEVSPFVA